MNWDKTESSFKYNGTPVTRKHASVKTPIGVFQVHEAVSGKAFIQNPLIKSDYILENPLFSYDNGCEEWFGPSKIFVKSFEEGIDISEKMWVKYKEIINSF
jgi:hypothetical protein